LRLKVLTTEFTGGRLGKIRVQLMIQRVKDVNRKSCLLLWDTGALSFITNQYACDEGIKGKKHQYRCRPRRQEEITDSVQGIESLLDGSLNEFRPYGVD
jgi:hypothetical protein